MKEFLSQKGVKYAERDVSLDRAAAMEMVAKSGQRGVPVTILDGEIVVGFNRPQLEQILESKTNRGKASLGITVADSIEGASGPATGALVGHVGNGSVGQRLGLRQGDVITSINNTNITGADDVETVMANFKPGQKISVMYFRGGQAESAETTL